MKLKHLENYCKQAEAVALLSPDEQKKVGAILISKSTGAVLANGYNGFIRGAADNKLPKTRPEKYEYIVHAEANLVYNCARHGIRTDDCFVFCTLSPCLPCTRSLFQSGIDTIVYKDEYRLFHEQLKALDIIYQMKKIGEYTVLTVVPRSEESIDVIKNP